MRALLLFANDAVGTVEGWLRLVDGQVVARGAGLDTLAPPEEEERLFLLLRGSEVTLRWLDLPDLTEAQALAAARIAIAESSLGAIDDLHVALGRVHGGHRVVATIAAAQIAAWIDWAASIGLDPDHVVPLPLLIAYGEGPTRVWRRPGRTLVHGPQTAFAIEPGLADAILGDAAIEEIDDAGFEADLPAALLALPIDLRQGDHRRRRVWRTSADWRRRMVRYAIAAVLLLALIPVARLGRLSWDSYRLRDEAAQVAQATLGLPDAPADPRGVLRQRLERLQGSGMGLVDGAAILFGAVRQTPNVQLSDLSYDDGGTLSASVTAASAADLAELVRRIGSSGLDVETSGGAAGTTLVRVRMP